MTLCVRSTTSRGSFRECSTSIILSPSQYTCWHKCVAENVFVFTTTKIGFFSRFRGDWTRGVRRTAATANLVLPGIKKAGGRPWPQKSVFAPSAGGKGMSYAGGARSAVARAAGAC